MMIYKFKAKEVRMFRVFLLSFGGEIIASYNFLSCIVSKKYDKLIIV